MEVTRLPPGRPSHATSGTSTTGWEPGLICSLSDLLVKMNVLNLSHQLENTNKFVLKSKLEEFTNKSEHLINKKLKTVHSNFFI